MAFVVMLGAFDTKGDEYAYVQDRIIASGCEAILIDTGVLGEPRTRATITREVVAERAGVSVRGLAQTGDRGAAAAAMGLGAKQIVLELYREEHLHGVLGLGGSGGTALITDIMQALPIGVPKLMVSTVASGDTRPYVGAVDITMMYSVTDIAGINSISERILTNAAAAIVGMANSYQTTVFSRASRPVIVATMFGITTPCVSAAREWFEAQGYEMLVFHATGAGGQAMEDLIRDGQLAGQQVTVAGVLDITTTELADELVGGVMSAGPHRLEAAAACGVPQVVSLGALNVVNFGSPESVPLRFRRRKLYSPNRAVTLMRTSSKECEQLGRILAEKLNRSSAPVAVFIPTRGVASNGVSGALFYDPAADHALIESFRSSVAPQVEIHVFDTDINDVHFAHAMAERLDAFIRQRGVLSNSRSIR